MKTTETKLIKLSDFLLEMLEYARTVVDLEDGETPEQWVNDYYKTVYESGKVIKIEGVLYVID